MPINPNVPIQTKGGVEANVQAHQAKVRELMVTTDSNNLYVGKGTGNNPVLVADATVPNRVSTLEGQLSTFYTSARDTFANESLIALNTNLTVSGGLIRPSLNRYIESMTGDISIDTVNSKNISTSNGDVRQVGTVGFDVDNNANFEGTFTTNPYTFSSATDFRVTPTFTDQTVSGKATRSPESFFTPLFTSETLIDVEINATTGDHFVAILDFNSTATPTTGRLILRRYDSNRTLITEVIQNIADNLALNTDTLIKNVSITIDDTSVFVAYPIHWVTGVTNLIKVRKYNYSFVQQAEWLPTMPTTPTTNHTTLGMDIAVSNNRLHLLYNYRVGATGTAVTSYYQYTATGATYGSASQSGLVTMFTSTAIDDTFNARLCPIIGTNLVGWVVSTRKSSLGLCFGIIDGASTTSPFQFRNATTYPAGSTGVAGGLVINVSANGVCDLVYDYNKSVFVIVFNGVSNSDIRATTIPATTTGVATTRTAITTAPYSTVGNRMIRAVMRGGTDPFGYMTVMWASGTRTQLYADEFYLWDISNPPVFVGTSGLNVLKLVQSTTAGYVGSFTTYLSPFKDSNNYNMYHSYVGISGSVVSIRQETNIKARLFVSLLNTSNLTPIGAEQECVSGSPNSWTVPARTQCRLFFRFFTPVYYYSAGNYYIPSNVSDRLTGYVFEQTSTPSGAGSGTFTSVPLITDRLVKQVTLTALSVLGTTVGNSITWEVASLGENWIQVGSGVVTTAVGTSNNWQVTFNQGYWGSQLRVRATLNYGAGVTDITTVPYINEYSVGVTSVLTNSDLLPLEINLMKMGINVNTLLTSQRTGYKNMMIDTFESSAGYTTVGGTPSLSNGTLTNTNVSSTMVVTSVVETADLTSVNSIICLWEGSTTNSPTNLQVSRDGGTTWYSITKETIFTFNDNIATKNQVRIRVSVPPNGSLFGWSYLYE